MSRIIFVTLVIALFIGNTAFAESIIRGTIKNTEGGTIGCYYKEHITDRQAGNQNIELVNGRFEIRINNVDAVEISFDFDNQLLNFFLLPDDSISFTCDAKDIKNSLKIKSSNYDDQLFMTGMSLIESLKLQGMAPYEVKGAGWENLPYGLIDSLTREMKKQQDAFKKSKASKLSLTKLLRDRLIDTTYKKARSIMTQFATQKAFGRSQGNQVSEQDVEMLLKDIKIENEDLLQNTDYIDFLYWYDDRAYEQYRQNNGMNSANLTDWAIERFTFQDKHYKSPKVKYAIQTHVLCKNNNRNPEIFTEGAARLNQMYPQGIYRDQLQRMALSVKTLKAGQPAPRFNLEDINGKMVSLESLKGKTIYIDFWASWCLPCVTENKAVKKIKPRYQDKDVLFLYITRDENEKVWKKAVAEQAIDGVHLFGGGTTVFDQYQVSGVPKYVLIDKEGKILTADAPRPSEVEELKKLIDQSLD